MYFIGLDVHKKSISYCVKDAAGRVYQEGKIGFRAPLLEGPISCSTTRGPAHTKALRPHCWEFIFP